MPHASQPRLSGPLAAAVALTAAAGFSDAHIFLHVTDVFVANMSGNLVLAGMALGEGNWRTGARHGTALVAFALGAALANWYHAWHRRTGRPMRPDLVLALEAALMLVVVAWIAALGGEYAGAPAFVYPVIGVGAFAMGVQNAALLRVGAVAVATTYASGSVARLGAESMLMVTASGADERSPHARAARVLAAVVLAYLAGAALAAWTGAATAWLLIPVVVLVATALLTHRRLADEPWDADVRPSA